ncbi:two-component sensor histidine kinase [Pikeienuella piscinae]|uniref:histidine kinase n=1 Tax=Pikeienuella piscinae TaxID=2748098 RepID=A0A7L5C0Y1_9RHOB|nr:ATP-binding protein [Pikeienuella piscinae]QIE56437.1 two-component sensor histidine kinase [Pikeienuella piscinae]
MIFKRYFPRSLFGRALIIFVAPVILLQAVVAYVFIQRHFDGATAQMARAVAKELNYAVDLVERTDDPVIAQSTLDELIDPLGMKFGLVEGAIVEPAAIRDFYDIPGGAVEEAFKREVHRPLALDLVSDAKVIDARVQTAKGVLRVLIPRDRMISSNPEYLLFWMFGTAAALMAVAVFFLRRQIQPIRALAAAADDFGKGRDTPFRPRGAEEVRRAGAAFLDMKVRLERQIEQRTKMLSGVSHDLKTPLTRMKLALAMLPPDAEVRELQRDVDEMERMLGEFLAFARGEQGEEISAVDPVEIAEEVAADARRRGATVSVLSTVDTPGDATAPLKRMAVKRALGNLVGNAVEFGDRIDISTRVTRKFIEFTVEDDGPGIPEAAREAAFRPFERLDAARNQDKGGGVGLGLSIALDIARGHGGELSLHESERLGGLKARFRAPR